LKLDFGSVAIIMFPGAEKHENMIINTTLKIIETKFHSPKHLDAGEKAS
jgi:hypothetical protein